MSDEDFTLETAVADAIATAVREVEAEPGFQFVIARRVLDAIAASSEQWVATKTDPWFEAATEIGGNEATIPGSCWHYYQHNNSNTAGDTANRNPDDTRYWHICELDNEIAQLVALRQLYARYRAGEQLPPCGHVFKSSGQDGQQCQCCGGDFPPS